MPAEMTKGAGSTATVNTAHQVRDVDKKRRPRARAKTKRRPRATGLSVGY